MEEYARESAISVEDIAAMDERRIEKLEEAGINEEDVLSRAKENINIWENYFNENITRGKDDMNFTLRDQWTAIERSEFTRLFRVCFTSNFLYDTVKKIAGEQRKNKPDLIVRSLTGKATQDQINLRADLVRTISYQSQNDLVYQAAFKSALLMGYGAFQIDIDYESPKSFKQIVKFNIIPDVTLATFDPQAIKPHKGDGNFCARRYSFSKEEFAASFPYISNPISYNDPRMLLEFEWETRDTIIVCDYYEKEWFPTIIYKLSNGMVVTKYEWEDMQESFKIKKALAKDSELSKLIMDEIPKIVMERQTQDYKIMHYRLIKDKIIDFTEWPSKHLPLIFVDGDSAFVDGKQYTRSFIRDARDVQKYANYILSERATEIKNRRREQWIGTPDNIIGHEQQWRNPEVQNGILMAKPDPKTGQMPVKQPAWELSPQLMQDYVQATNDIRQILGFSEAAAGQESNEQSGKAIANRQIASSMSAYVFRDNLNQAIEQGGRVVLDLLPAIIGDDERHMVVSKADGKTKSVILNKKGADGEIENPISKGDYDIEIDTGPSFAIQKAASLELFMALIQANPQVFPLVADLIAKNLDIQYMPQIEERFKTLVPPQILAKEQGEPPPPPQPDPQQMMMQAELQDKMHQLQIRQEELEIRKQKHEIEKAELFLQAQEVSEKMGMERNSHVIDLHKAELDYAAKMHKIMADLHHKSTHV